MLRRPEKLVPVKNPGGRKLTAKEREDARDLALIRRELAKGGKTYSFAQVMREMGYDDLARKVH